MKVVDINRNSKSRAKEIVDDIQKRMSSGESQDWDAKVYRDHYSADTNLLNALDRPGGSGLAPEVESSMMKKAKTDAAAAEYLLKKRGFEKFDKSLDGKWSISNKQWGFRHPMTGRVLRSLGILGGGLAAVSAPDAGAAVMDAVVPGGVEPMGVSEEQRELDRKYQDAVRRMAK